MESRVCLKHVFLDPPLTVSSSKNPAKRGLTLKQIATSDYCRICGFFVYVNSTGQSPRSRKANRESLFESVRQGVTIRKLADGLRDLPFRKQMISQAGFVRLAVITLEAPELDFRLLKAALRARR